MVIWKKEPIDQYQCLTIARDIDKNLALQVTPTVMGSFRVHIVENDTNLLVNWCAGKMYSDVLFLISILGYILENDVDGLLDGKYPFCSTIKPYFNDVSFNNIIKEIAPSNYMPGYILTPKDLDDILINLVLYYKNI